MVEEELAVELKIFAMCSCFALYRVVLVSITADGCLRGNSSSIVYQPQEVKRLSFFSRLVKLTCPVVACFVLLAWVTDQGYACL